MAGIGVKLRRIYEKNTLTSNLVGFGYSAVITVAPMFLMIGTVFLMGRVLGFSQTPYAQRELFSTTLLYVFIFSLLTAAPFNSVLSRYMSDAIYEEHYENILPCFYVGLLMNMLVSCLLGIPFCIHERVAGRVDILYVFTGYCGYVSLVLVFYSMLYLSVCKDYKNISLFFFIGMLAAFLLSLFFVFVLQMSVTFSMLLALSIGFLIIGCEEIALIKQYFKENGRAYREVLSYFKKYWQLVGSNFFYILGLYIHNFVFWTTDLKMTVRESFVCAPSYDMATCIAMFTNISATVIFISRVEMYFRDKYRDYSQAVIGGRGADIHKTKLRMFRQLAMELMSLARIQFMISVVVFLLCIIFLPQKGFSGMVMQIYPCLAAGYFMLFLMYSAIIFLYYFNDVTGAMCTALVFTAATLLGSLFAVHLPVNWYGSGVIIGSLSGWAFAYGRLRWVEKNMDIHVFCKGILIPYGKGKPASSKVYDRNEQKGEEEKDG